MPEDTWEWLWHKVASRNCKNLTESVSQSLNDHEETIKECLITLDEAIHDGVKEGEENVFRSWGKSSLCQETKFRNTVPEAMWETVDVPT